MDLKISVLLLGAVLLHKTDAVPHSFITAEGEMTIVGDPETASEFYFMILQCTSLEDGYALINAPGCRPSIPDGVHFSEIFDDFADIPGVVSSTINLEADQSIVNLAFDANYCITCTNYYYYEFKIPGPNPEANVYYQSGHELEAVQTAEPTSAPTQAPPPTDSPTDASEVCPIPNIPHANEADLDDLCSDVSPGDLCLFECEEGYVHGEDFKFPKCDDDGEWEDLNEAECIAEDPCDDVDCPENATCSSLGECECDEEYHMNENGNLCELPAECLDEDITSIAAEDGITGFYGDCSTYEEDKRNHAFCDIDMFKGELVSTYCQVACKDEGCRICSKKTCSSLGLEDEISNNICADTRMGNVCSGRKTFSDAVEFCRSYDMRLCTLSEIEQNITDDTGCGYDSAEVWSASLCECGGHWTPFGVTGNQNEPLRCSANCDLYYVRCCGDGIEATGDCCAD